jgi:hypothetical protein
MSSLEQIVRPFADIGTEPIKGVASVPLPSTNVTLVVSGGGSVVSGSISYSYSFSNYADAKESELQADGTPFSG